MKRKQVIALLLVLCGLFAVAGGIWWYYEENARVTLPVDEKMAIEISKKTINRKYWKELIAVGGFGDNVKYFARQQTNSFQGNSQYWRVDVYVRGYHELASLVEIDIDTGEVLFVGDFSID